MEYTQKYLGVKGLMPATYYQMIQKKEYWETESLIKQMRQKCKQLVNLDKVYMRVLYSSWNIFVKFEIMSNKELQKNLNWVY